MEKVKVNNVLCERIIDVGRSSYGRIIVVIFKYNDNIYDWVTSGKTKELSKIGEGGTYNIEWVQGIKSVSYVKVVD